MMAVGRNSILNCTYLLTASSSGISIIRSALFHKISFHRQHVKIFEKFRIFCHTAIKMLSNIIGGTSL